MTLCIAPPESTRAQDNAPETECQRNLIEPLNVLAGEAGSAVEQRWPDGFVAAATRLCGVLSATSGTTCLRTFIAMVPDPIDSGLVYQFESALQAIRLGFEQALPKHDSAQQRVTLAQPQNEQYFRDRAFLPWSEVASTDATKPAVVKCRRSLPGLMLFRNSKPDAPEVALVFVVGETATSGVNAVALRNALLAIDALTPQAEVPIIGPTFSGSAYSLRVALESFAQTGGTLKRFRVISGTATGMDVPSLLRTGTQGDAARISYQATSLPGTASHCAYMWFLRSRLKVPVRQSADGVRRLVGVASLRESGTEFGAVPVPRASPCQLEPELQLSFPANISMLRDAYEKLDQDQEASKEPVLGRATMLDVSLAQRRTATELESVTSPRMRAALDLMLSQVLSELSHHEIKHVSVQATDVGDSIFLARKLRDIAPDVRLAFSEPDEMLLHPQYRDSLKGSLVVSPYPFLGAGGISSDLDVHGGFANAGSQGLFNAVLAQRGARPQDLFKYFFAPRSDDTEAENGMKAAPLLVWVATIGRDSIVPIDVKAPIDCAETIYGATPSSDLPGTHDVLCSRSRSATVAASGPDRKSRRSAWQKLNWVNKSSTLKIDSSASLPHLWNLLYLVLCAGFIVDWIRQSVAQRRLARDRMPKSFLAESDDRAADRAIGRTSWRLYAAIRRFLFVLAFLYMGAVYFLVLIVRAQQHAPSSQGQNIALDPPSYVVGTLVLAFLVSACFAFWQSATCFTRDFVAFARYVGATIYPRSWKDILDGFRSGRTTQSRLAHYSDRPVGYLISKVSVSLGIAEPVDREQAARVSFAQLRFLAMSALSLAAGFAALVTAHFAMHADPVMLDDSQAWSRTSTPVLALTVLRSVSLLSGVSPAAPALSCWLCVYVWCIGRMARLAHAHFMSRVSPGDGEADLVSTPIRLVLYPGQDNRRTPDEGYTQAERDLLNAIWRPIVGRTYIAATLAIFVMPFALAIIKPLSTLEESTGTWLLAGALGLSVVLIGVTWIQLIQFWLRLQCVLGRTLVHELGPAFANLPAFVRASLEELLSRSSRELLRWVECARGLSGLLARVPRGRDDSTPVTTDKLRSQGLALRAYIQHALEMADSPKLGPQESSLALPTPDEAESAQLAEQVIAAASNVALLLEHRRAQARGRLKLLSQYPPPLAQASGHDVSHVRVPGVHDGPSLDALDRTCVAPPFPANVVTTQPERFGATSARRGVEHWPPNEPSQPAPLPESGPVSALADNSDGWAEWQASAEIAVITVATLLLQQHIRQFRYFMSTLVSMSLLLLLIVTSYPFEPNRLLLTYIWVIVGSVVLTGLWIYVQLGRDRLMRCITNTGAKNIFSTSLGLRLLGWVVVPLLSLAAAQYPEFANLLLRLFVPFARALN